MPKIQGSIRPLIYPLQYNADIESDTPNDTITHIDLSNWQSNDADERLNVVMNLSLNEYVSIASALDVGRDISHGDNSIEIWWVWTRILFSMDICQSIIDCISDPNSGVPDAILNLTNSTNIDNLRDVSQYLNGYNLSTTTNPTCDYDILFGQAIQLVEYMNQVNVDILEIVEVATNPSEMVADVLGDVTGIDETSIDAFLAWLSKIQDNIIENYNAQITTAYLEGVACDIFCIAKDNGCAITPELIFDVFKARLSATVTIESLINETLIYLVGGVWSGTEIADFMFFSQAGIRSQVGRILGLSNWSDLDIRMRVYANDPNPDWSILCSCTWSSTIDFTTGQNNFVFALDDNSAPVGQWTNGVGLESVPVLITQARRQLLGTISFDTSNVTSIRMIGSFTKGTQSGSFTPATFIRFNLSGTEVPGTRAETLYSAYTTGVATPVDIQTSGYNVSADSLSVFMRPATFATNGYSVCTSLVITGIGDKPPQLP